MKCNWKSKKAIGFYVFAFLVFLVGVPKPLFYSIEGVSGYFTDAATGQPIAGVAVEVWWAGQASGYEGWHSAGGWGLQYSRTNEEGFFSVPGYRVRWREWFSTRSIGDNVPRVSAIKSGYSSISVSAPIAIGLSLNFSQHPRELESFFVIGGKVVGFKDLSIAMNKSDHNAIKRYRQFHQEFALGRGLYAAVDCYSDEFKHSGFLQELYDEQAWAYSVGLKTRSTEWFGQLIASGEPTEEKRFQMACKLIRSNLNLKQY